MKSFLIYLLSFLVAAGLGFGAMHFLKPVIFADNEPVAVVDTHTLSQAAPAEPAAEEYDLEDEASDLDAEEEPEPEKTVPEPVKEQADEFEIDITSLRKPSTGEGLYKVYGMKTKGAQGTVRYTLTDAENTSNVYNTDSNGAFVDVKANTNGHFILVAKDLSTGKIAKKSLYGIKYVKPVEKLSASEIEKIINSGNSANLQPVSDRMAGNVKVNCNLSDVTSLRAAFSRVNMEDMKATVTNVQYDGTGRVTAITLTLQ
ncbi:MAG: hypothetical protein J5695_02755 [Bacteroidales bacterium]|nr:hypothetical protein [Bacteroidales bacterium]